MLRTWAGALSGLIREIMERFWSSYWNLQARLMRLRERVVGPLDPDVPCEHNIVPLVTIYALMVVTYAFLSERVEPLIAFCQMALWFFLIVGSLIVIPLLINLAYAIWMNMRPGGGWPEEAIPPEPAFRSYFFKKGLQDLRCILRDVSLLNLNLTQELLTIVRLLIANPVFPILWIFGILVGIDLMFALAAAILASGALAGLFAAAVVFCCAVLAVVAGIFRLSEILLMQCRRIYLVCPNAGCYRHISLPVYRCPKCHSEHRSLVPGSYGIFQRRCQCTVRLGTMRISGRTSLSSFCPHAECGKPLPQGIETRRAIHISFVGGPNAGKTTLLATSVHGLIDTSTRGGLALQIPRAAQQRALEAFRALIEQRQFPSKTQESLPDAFVAYLQDCNRCRVAIYLYDPAGEAFREKTTLLSQRYQSIVSAVVFLVDPFSIRMFANYRAAEEPDRKIVPGEDPQAVYARFVAVLRQSCTGGGNLVRKPIAVVVTKADELNLAAGAKAREWLESFGQGNLVRSIENDFENVEYFFVSVDPAATATAATAPIEWLLTYSGLQLNGAPAVAARAVGSAAAEGT